MAVALFIEVQHNDTMEDEDGWVQIFQPYGLPQEGPLRSD